MRCRACARCSSAWAGRARCGSTSSSSAPSSRRCCWPPPGPTPRRSPPGGGGRGGQPPGVARSPGGVPGAIVDPAEVIGEEIAFTGALGAPVNGYLARPAAPGSLPGMIVIHEASGLGGHIRDVTNRIANLGYVALGVDLY